MLESGEVEITMAQTGAKVEKREGAMGRDGVRGEGKYEKGKL